jgi:hypothetical protein
MNQAEQIFRPQGNEKPSKSKTTKVYDNDGTCREIEFKGGKIL